MADFRRGDLAGSEKHFLTALKINSQSPEALSGLARIYSTVSLFRKARDLRVRAYRFAPDDPALALAYANTLRGAAHIAALEKLLAVSDPASEDTRRLRAHIASDKALGDRQAKRLISPYEASKIKLFRIQDGPSRMRIRGLGLTLRLNNKQNVTLLLDTGASGIAISPRTAERAGLEILGGETTEIKGIGDKEAQSSVTYLASHLRVGTVEFADYPISAFRSAKDTDIDGLMGADVFARFIVGIDFQNSELILEPRPAAEAAVADEPVDRLEKPAEGFHQVFRFGNHLVVPTQVNGKRAVLFLVDSGSSANLIDTDTAREFTGVSSDSNAIVRGIQGKVNEASRAHRISLVFAGFRQDNPDLLSISLEKMSDSIGTRMGGILGMPVLGQLKMTIDYRNGTIRFDRRT